MCACVCVSCMLKLVLQTPSLPPSIPKRGLHPMNVRNIKMRLEFLFINSRYGKPDDFFKFSYLWNAFLCVVFHISANDRHVA